MKMFSRKADGGLSMSFVVILAISLVVMIVIIGIFTGRSRDGDKALRGCEARGGECVPSASDGSDPCADDKYITELPEGLCDAGSNEPVCCLKNFDFGSTSDSSSSGSS